MPGAPAAFRRLDELPRARLAHLPTPIEEMPNLAAALGGDLRLYVKRDDCTGLAFGGNKIRQLEFYMGEAQAAEADTILITAAVQSNFIRSAAAAARKLGMDCHIQLEERVPRDDATYHQSGNVLIDKLLGATLYSYPDGEDEAGADARIAEIAKGLNRRPYIIHLAPGHLPLGALGYVDAARELVGQMAESDLAFDEIVVASGSGHTHGGLLLGLRALGCDVPVTRVCVRRAFHPALFSEHQAEIVLALGIGGIKRYGTAKAGHRVIQPRMPLIHVAQVNVISRLMGHRGDSPQNQLFGQAEIASLMGNTAQQVVGVSMTRFHGKNLAIYRLSFLNATRHMQVHALVHEARGIERQVAIGGMAVRNRRRGAILFCGLAHQFLLMTFFCSVHLRYKTTGTVTYSLTKLPKR